MTTTHYPHLIGLTGLAGTGKDTVRAALEAHHGYEGIAFADPIRHMLARLLTYTGEPLDWMTSRALKEQTIPAIGQSYRQLAQTLGTEWGRTCNGNDFWLRMAGERINAVTAIDEQDRLDTLNVDAVPTRFVISDVRFVNEAKWVKARGGVIWHIVRPGTEAVHSHASEASVAAIAEPPGLVDCTLINDGTLDQLQDVVETLLMMHDVAGTESYKRPSGTIRASTARFTVGAPVRAIAA